MSSSQQTRFVERVVALFEKYDPSKVENAEKLVQNSAGREQELIDALVSRYGPEDEEYSPLEEMRQPQTSEAIFVTTEPSWNVFSTAAFVGIANFPASSTTPHRTLLRPVFLQHIHRFGATKFESPITFKNVTSSWEDAMLNYSSIAVCWGNVRCLIGQALVIDKMERLVLMLTRLWHGCDPLCHIDADRLLIAAIQRVGPDATPGVVEKIFKVTQQKYFGSFYEYLTCKFRQTFSHHVIVMFFKVFSAFSKKRQCVDLIYENLRLIETSIFSGERFDHLHKQRVFGALLTAAASPQLSALNTRVSLSRSAKKTDDNDEEGASSKEERADKTLFFLLTASFYVHPEILSPSSIVQYFELIKKQSIDDHQSTTTSSAAATTPPINNNTESQVVVDDYRRQLLFFKDGTLVFRALLASSVETATIEKYLDLVQQEEGASEMLLQEIENTADDKKKNILVPFFGNCKCIDADRFKLLMTFLQKSSSTSPKQIFSELLHLDKKEREEGSAEEEKTEDEEKKKSGTEKVLLGPQFLFRELCQNKNLTFSGFKSFVDTLREMNLLEDFLLQAVVRGIPQDINNTTTAASYCVSLLFNCQSLETVQYFFEHFCSNNKTIIKKLLSPKYLLFFVCKDLMDNRNVVVFACDLMCEYGFFDEQYERCGCQG